VDGVSQLAVALVQDAENFESLEHLVIVSSVVPAESVEQMHILILIVEFLVFNDVKDALNNLRELLLDADLSNVATTLHTSQAVKHTHLVAAKGALQPLDDIEESCGRETQVHSKVDQGKAGRAAKTRHKCSLHALLKLLASDWGLQDAENRESTRLNCLNLLVCKGCYSASRLTDLLPLLKSITPVELFLSLVDGAGANEN